MVLLYVDDILYNGTRYEVELFEAQMKDTYQLKSKSCATTYIGLQLKLNAQECNLNQQRHIEAGAARFNVETMRPQNVPFTDADLSESVKLDDPKLYQAAVGWLNYVGGSSRPDISYAVSVLPRSNMNPTVGHLKKAKNVIRYLLDTKTWSLKFKPVAASGNTLEMHTDASFANGPSRKSQFGYIILLNGNVIVYRSKLEPLVTLSSTEAEYIAISCAIKDFIWILKILKELDVELKDRIIHCDNQPAIRILKTRGFTRRTKYLDCRYEFIKQELINRHIEVRYVPTIENKADILTKALGRVKYAEARQKILIEEPKIQSVREGVVGPSHDPNGCNHA